MNTTERNALRDRLLCMIAEHPSDAYCSVHECMRDDLCCKSCFDALAAVALANTAGSTLLDHTAPTDEEIQIALRAARESEYSGRAHYSQIGVALRAFLAARLARQTQRTPVAP